MMKEIGWVLIRNLQAMVLPILLPLLPLIEFYQSLRRATFSAVKKGSICVGGAFYSFFKYATPPNCFICFNIQRCLFFKLSLGLCTSDLAGEGNTAAR